MQIDAIKATSIELTEGLRAAVEEELMALEPLTERWGTAVRAHAEIGKTTHHHHKGEVFRAEFNLTIPGNLLRAEATHGDLYAAIRDAGKELERQLNEEKDRGLGERRLDEEEGEEEGAGL